MSESMQLRPFGELVESFDARRVPVREADRRAGPFPYFGASGVVDYVDGYLFDGEYLLVAEDGENLRTRQTPIAFLARGKFWVNNHAHVVKATERADTRFLMYALQFVDVGAFLTGSTMPKLTQGNLHRLPVPAPDVHTQRAIASILGALDDKIDLNRRMNETLEAMARAIFKSWFVDFDPVRAKMEGRQPVGMDAETAALFPSRMVRSEVGEVPEGWAKKGLSDAAELNPTLRCAKGESLPYVEMASLPTRGHRPSEWPLREVASGTRFQNGDTLLARITPCLENGKTGYVDFLGQGQVAWGSTEYIVIRPRPPLPPEWGYLLARHPDFRTFAVQHMEGTSGRQRVSAAVVGLYSVAVPDGRVGGAFGSIVRPMFERMSAGSAESQTLAHLRDLLLPRLLSGELRIRDAERTVEAVL